MKIAVVVLILMLGAIALLWINDNVNPWLVGGGAILLLCVPISLALFAFLSHRQQEQK